MKKIYSVSSDNINSRLDRWFKKNVFNVPQSLIEKNIRKGKIKINNIKEKSSYRLKKNDQIILHNISFTNKSSNKVKSFYRPTKKDLSKSSKMFIENNENFVVINKPAGIAVQSGTKSRKNILDILRNTQEFKNTSPYTVHRIDKETTGVLIVAKNKKYAQLFTSLFRIRKIYKSYLCIVIGSLDKDKGTLIDDLVHYEGNKKVKTKAITQYTVLDSKKNYSFLKLNPHTGRKHQLRKQLLMRGCPILGDDKYRISESHSKKNILMLHANKINFSINDIKYSFSAELPMAFRKALNERYLKNF
tara:strand:- start:106 stop:1014 length:909 start_codon:yes stop_codon:yes gene_type:complete